MAFNSGSAVLTASLVTQRVRERGPHFQLVPSSSSSSNPLSSSSPSSSSSPPSPPSPSAGAGAGAPSQFPRFKLYPHTLTLDPRTTNTAAQQLNIAVHSEWAKGRGSAWVLGVPSIDFVSESFTFQLNATTAVSESGLEAALDTLEDAALDNCLSTHLVEGGDDRLHLHPTTQTNKYHCPPYPLGEDVIIRGSCTCSAPSKDGFEAARHLLRRIWQGTLPYQRAFDDTRSAISRLLAIRTPHQTILHPSGSDAELIPVAIAALRARAQSCTRIINIVVAAGEVGSGTAPAAGGRHFSAFAPSGSTVVEGAVADDFPDNLDVVEIKPRGGDGAIHPDYDALVMDAVATAERDHELPYFIVHAVDGSKTGLRVPSRSAISKLHARLGDRLLIVLDACQCRSEAAEIEWFLERGAVVLVTASKFFGAPGFCGAVLVPLDAARLLGSQTRAPAGLSDYLTKWDVPQSMTGLYNSLPEGPINIGLLTRWACGLAEMELFTQQGRLVKDAMRNWVHGVSKLVEERSPKMSLIGVADGGCGAGFDDDTRYGGINSIVSIKFLTTCGSKHLCADTLKNVHRLLTIDASAELPSYATDVERKIASRRCFVGQPVKLGDYGVLRLAIGATLAREIAATRNGLAEALREDSAVLDKMAVLSKYCEDM